MKQTDDMSARDSLQLINEMIGRAKSSFAGISFYFLLWGVLLATAGIGEYILDKVLDWAHPYAVWPVVSVIGVIVAVWKGRRDEERRVPGYADRIFSYLWGSFGVTLVLLIITTVGHEMDPGPFILVLTGLPTFATGGIVRFRPLIIGGLLFWSVGLFSFFYLEEFTSLLFSLAIIFGYIIPGIMLVRKEQGK